MNGTDRCREIDERKLTLAGETVTLSWRKLTPDGGKLTFAGRKLTLARRKLTPVERKLILVERRFTLVDGNRVDRGIRLPEARESMLKERVNSLLAGESSLLTRENRLPRGKSFLPQTVSGYLTRGYGNSMER